MDKLKPCRRCGSHNIELHGTKEGDTPWIFCRNCGLLFERLTAQGIPAIITSDRLVELWNRRADDGKTD